MRTLTGLLVGTLLVAFAFPAFFIVLMFFAAVLFFILLFSVWRGGRVHVYTSRGQYGACEPRREAPPHDPEIIDTTEHDTYDGENDYTDESGTQQTPDDDEPTETVELPATALHKEDENKQ